MDDTGLKKQFFLIHVQLRRKATFYAISQVQHTEEFLLIILDSSNNCRWCIWLSWWWIVSWATQEVHLGRNLKEEVDNGDWGDTAATWFIHPHPSSKTQNYWFLEWINAQYAILGFHDHRTGDNKADSHKKVSQIVLLLKPKQNKTKNSSLNVETAAGNTTAIVELFYFSRLLYTSSLVFLVTSITLFTLYFQNLLI